MGVVFSLGLNIPRVKKLPPEKGGCQESCSSLAFIMKKLFMKTINCCGLCFLCSVSYGYSIGQRNG